MTIGICVFVSPVSGDETRRAISERLGWPDCGGGILRAHSCGGGSPDQLIARVHSSALGATPDDPARVLLGEKASSFAVGSVVVEVLVGSD